MHFILRRFTKVAIGSALGAGMLLSAGVASAASLTSAQISAVTSLLTAFGVSADTITNVQSVLSGGSVATSTGSGTSNTGVLIGLLRKGDHGQDVCYLHALLATDPTITANITANDVGTNCPFGSLTESALKQFQKNHGLDAVGVVGPKTLALLNALLGSNPLSFEDEDNATSTNMGGEHGHRVCAIVPPGHLIAPGWLRHYGNEQPVVPPCQTLPPGGGSTGTTTPPTPPADTTAPVVSNLAVGGVATTSATITWTTDENASSNVYYSSSASLNFATALSATLSGLSTAHSVMLTGLTASTTYNYAVVSADFAGNAATSSTLQFTTGQ